MNCIRKFFRKRFRYESRSWPTWKDLLEEEEEFLAEEAKLAAQSSKAEGGDEAGEEGLSVSHADKGQEENVAETSENGAKRRLRLDLEVEASGFGRAMQRELEDVCRLLAF